MKTFNRGGAIWQLVAVLLGLGVMVGAFLANASPYVTIKEASGSAGDSLHLAGDIVPGSLLAQPKQGIVDFELKDQNGDQVKVRYEGPPPANMGEATKVVAIGSMKEGRFVCKKLLLKCPSKYESKENGASGT